MGNNQAYSDFEEITVGLYNIGKLDLPALDVIGVCFFTYPDIDSGGSRGLLTNDGKDVLELVVTLLDPTYPIPPADTDDWELVDRYYDKFHALAESRWCKSD